MDKLKEAYRKFLNSKAGRSIEPNSIITPLVKSKIITKDEAEIIKNEPTRAKRQYVSYDNFINYFVQKWRSFTKNRF